MPPGILSVYYWPSFNTVQSIPIFAVAIGIVLILSPCLWNHETSIRIDL